MHGLDGIKQMNAEEKKTLAREQTRIDNLIFMKEHQPEKYSNLMAKKWLPTLRKATPKEYQNWLDQFLDGGGSITHTYDYNMPDNFYIATENIKMTERYGSQSVHVIAPLGIDVKAEADDGDIGHCNIYHHTKDGPVVDGLFVPCYNNT